jgi:hypothetical protein
MALKEQELNQYPGDSISRYIVTGTRMRKNLRKAALEIKRYCAAAYFKECGIRGGVS